VIRTNLSTRPFYNTRVVRVLLGLLVVLVVSVTAYNVIQLVRLAASQRTLGANAATAEREAARLRAEAAQTLSRVDPKELAVVDRAAREANGIIDQRTFSWTNLFAYFERTLPADVRITSVQQQAGRQGVIITAEARNIADVDEFIEALEDTGSFRDVVPRTETLMEDDIIVATLEATYTSPSGISEASR
jgi:Tfp pilus assembly protein PilN